MKTREYHYNDNDIVHSHNWGRQARDDTPQGIHIANLEIVVLSMRYANIHYSRSAEDVEERCDFSTKDKVKRLVVG